MPVIPIDDLSRPELMPYARLTERENRSVQGLIIAESAPVIRLALQCGVAPVSMLMDRRHAAGKAADLIARVPDIPVYTAGESVLKALTGYSLTRGILCAMRRPEARPWRSLTAGRRFALLCDLTDGANVGALIRSAAALGADAVFLSPGCCDPLTRKAIRASMGSVFPLPFAVIPREDWPQAFFDGLEASGIVSAAMTLKDGSVPLNKAVLPGNKGILLVLGPEGPGLPEAVEERCTLRVHIPMHRSIDSLNVGAAGAIAFWEMFR